jgi:DNA-binding PadR family transcriptional regulator
MDRASCEGKYQYEIYKALNAKKVNWWPLHPGLNK